MARLPLIGRRLLWFVGIWAASVLAVGVIAEGLHWVLLPN